MANKLLFSEHGIEIQCPRGDTATYELLAQFYPLHSNRIKTEFHCSIHKTPEILQAFRGITLETYHTLPDKVRYFYMNELLLRNEMQDLITNGPRESCVVNEHLTLMRHQQLGREIARYQSRYAFFYDTRTGKTPLSLAIIDDDLRQHPNHKWLVVCPLILIENAWLEDAARFMPHIKAVGLWGSTAAKRDLQFAKPANLYIINTEAFSRNKERLEHMGFCGCIVDESSDMKSHSSKVSDDLVDFAQKMARFYLLSGTPAPNGEWEYYMQLRAVDFYGMQQSYTQFEQYYFMDLSFNSNYKKLAIRPDRKEELNKVLKQYSIYVDKEDVLTTPGREFIRYELELPSELKAHYNTLKNELYVELCSAEGSDKLVITAPSVAAKLNKLNQVTSGFIIDTKAVKENKYHGTEKEESYILSSYRFDALYKLLDQIGTDQVIIWCNYRKEFEVLKLKFGRRAKYIYGGTSAADKNEAVQQFKCGNVRYLVANPASADKGLTLTNCHINIYFSLNWSYEQFKQSSERIYADISKQPKFCTYYIFLAKGTIDTILYDDVLQGKGMASHAVLDHLKGANI